MLRILDPEPAAATASGGAHTHSGGSPSADSPDTNEGSEIPGEVEIVLGRRQIASLSFVVVVALAVASGAAYFAGKAAAGKAEVRPVATSDSKPAALAPPPLVTAELKADPSKTSVHDPAPRSATPQTNAGVNALIAADASTPADESVFGEPTPGSLYVQVGALDRGPAMILTTGLRKRGFPSITSKGPSATIFRVLVGPYKTLPEYENAKEAIGQMGITAFGRYGGQ